MNNCNVNKKSNPKHKKSNKQQFPKAKNVPAKSDLLSGQQDSDKTSKNKSAAIALTDRAKSSDNCVQREQASDCEKISPVQANENENRIITTSLLNALKSLHGENGTNHNELLKKLFNSTFENDSKASSLFGLSKDDFRTDPVIEGGESDDEDEFVEYVFTPRRYFMYSLCEFCKKELTDNAIPCRECNMTYYCSLNDMEKDLNHKQLCLALKQIGYYREAGYIYSNVWDLDPDGYRAYRVENMTACEMLLQRSLLPYEKEILIFPKVCMHCKEWRQNYLTACRICGQVSCRNLPEDYEISHQQWCKPFSLLRKLILLQQIKGTIEPVLPRKVLTDSPTCRSTMKSILNKINADYEDECRYAAITQIASAPLTTWYGLKLTEQLHKEVITIHLIGAEMQFEADVMDKWELFILHIAPGMKELNIVFVGPELVPKGISMQPSIKNKVCEICHKNKRTVNLYFVDSMYHEYSTSSSYKTPNLICFFNPGLHRTTGFNNEDSWPETIKTVSKQKCPILITSYTEFESPLDFQRFLKETIRSVNIILPPTQNPFSSSRPERNFISDEVAPLIFKNYFIFIID